MSAKLSYCFLVALVYPFASPAREWVSCVKGWGILMSFPGGGGRVYRYAHIGILAWKPLQSVLYEY